MPSSPSRSSLAATRLGADTASRTLVMLHGIYGRGRNWQAVARGIVASRPEYACWLVDMPHHGESGPGRHGDTVAGLAADVDDWMREADVTPDAILGHSYGGKVTLALGSRPRRLPLQLWIVDSTPETKPPGGSAWSMLDVVRRMPTHVARRTDINDPIMQAGFSIGVAQWMGTNLVRDDEGFHWRLDFDVMERLLEDFFQTDYWEIVEHTPEGLDIHVLKASESNAISTDAVARLRAAEGPRLHLHQRDGGHWIHAESPAVVTALVAEHLPRPSDTGE